MPIRCFLLFCTDCKLFGRCLLLLCYSLIWIIRIYCYSQRIELSFKQMHINVVRMRNRDIWPQKWILKIIPPFILWYVYGTVLGFDLIEFYCLSSIIGSVRVDVDESNWHLDLLGSDISVALSSAMKTFQRLAIRFHMYMNSVVRKGAMPIKNHFLINAVHQWNDCADLHNDVDNKPQF